MYTLEDSKKRKMIQRIIFTQGAPYYIQGLTALVTSLLPPLYFFTFVYYTDIPAIATVLILLLLSQKDSNVSIFVAGIFSLLMRQTNIIWIFMLAADFVFKQSFQLLKKSKSATSHTKISTAVSS